MQSRHRPVHNIAVIGAGPAGRSVAFRCATAGLNVVLEDVMPARLRRAQAVYSDSTGAAGGVLRYALTIEEAVREADLAIDFVPDELESKLEIFSLLDRMAPPRTILCTPTRSLSITDLASCTYRPELCVGIDEPEHGALAGPVAILRSRFVQDSTLAAVQGFLSRIGLAAEIVEDRTEPMLLKNLPRSQQM